MQRQAGGVDRQPLDDGGHYIAPRFGGPAEAFNHFAHDANANRGRYRALEDGWAAALKAGKHVTVAITPLYSSRSVRPDVIRVSYVIDGQERVREVENRRLEK